MSNQVQIIQSFGGNFSSSIRYGSGTNFSNAYSNYGGGGGGMGAMGKNATIDGPGLGGAGMNYHFFTNAEEYGKGGNGGNGGIRDILYFSYTGSVQYWTVPKNCEYISVDMWGGGGSGGSFISGTAVASGGAGGYTK